MPLLGASGSFSGSRARDPSVVCLHLPQQKRGRGRKRKEGRSRRAFFFSRPSRRSGSGRHAPLPGFLAVAAAHAAAAPVAPVLGEQREPKQERVGARFNKKAPSSPVEGPAANLTQHGAQTPETLFGFEGVPTRSAVGRSAGCSPALGRSHPRSPPSRSPRGALQVTSSFCLSAVQHGRPHLRRNQATPSQRQDSAKTTRSWGSRASRMRSPRPLLQQSTHSSFITKPNLDHRRWSNRASPANPRQLVA